MTTEPSGDDYDLARLDRAMEIIGVSFRDLTLLRTALVHRSYLNERGADAETVIRESNERLEFLGDAVLGLCSATWVYKRFPNEPEGVLTANRVSLVRTETLAEWAQQLGIPDLLYMARGELGADGEARPRMLAGALEAIIGAIFLDRGIREARAFVNRLLRLDASARIAASEFTNYKGRLQEFTQERDKLTPSYRTVDTSGPAHDRTFVVHAMLRGETIGAGSGPNKRAAEQSAARNALEHLALEGEAVHGRPVR